MMIVGISGKKYSGKSTIASYLVTQDFREFSFAYPLKNACKELFLLSDSQLNTEKEILDTRWDMSPRQMFQKVGELFRSIRGDFFIHHLRTRLAENEQKDIVNIVISDIRYENEAEFIREHDGILIKVIRPDFFLYQEDSHDSETNIVKINTDFVVFNNGNFETLYNQIDEIISKILLIQVD
jgi:hypothetical protein